MDEKTDSRKRTKTKEKGPLAQLMEYAGSYKRLTILGCTLSGISAAVGILTYLFVWVVARGVFRAMPALEGIGVLTRYGWYALTAAILSSAIYFAGLMCTHLAAFRTATNMRKRAAAHLLHVPLGFFNANLSGSIRKQIDDNAALTETLLAHNLPDAVGGIVTPVCGVLLLFLFDWRMGLTCLVPMLISFTFLMTMMGGMNATPEEIEERRKKGKIKAMDFYNDYQRSGERMSAEATEYVRGIPVVKVFQQTVHSFKGFKDAIDENSSLAAKYSLMCAQPYTWFTVVLNSSFMFLLPVGMIIIAGSGSGWEKLADLVFYIFFAPQLAFMMDRIMYVSNAFMDAHEATFKLKQILKEAPLADGQGTALPEDAANDIVFNNVTFSYEEGIHPAISNVSLTIPKGSTCALVGPSGGGKTTLARLIPRFFDVREGSVTIGGIDVRAMKESALMDMIAFVFQDAKLFKKSIRENIAAAKEGATEEEILSAAHAAQCDDILEKVPGGLNAVIGTKGVYLSGGEVQRIALARAILKDAPIVILDEASAFADPENEALIQKGFEALMKDKTVLMIAHRLSTVKNADRIFVLADGRVEEEGTHDELMERNGLYARMRADYEKAAAWKIGGAA
ncbi:MAG: ABC transporter ATP-binding protein [Lachnospiraceae bacterium]|nr:ABC transporter ATP-binding protein [Lachnospiraceae bacterium]